MKTPTIASQNHENMMLDDTRERYTIVYKLYFLIYVFILNKLYNARNKQHRHRRTVNGFFLLLIEKHELGASLRNKAI